MLFGADYISLYRGEEMRLLSSTLSSAALAYVVSNRHEVAHVLPRRAIAQIGRTAVRGRWRSLRSVMPVLLRRLVQAVREDKPPRVTGSGAARALMLLLLYAIVIVAVLACLLASDMTRGEAASNQSIGGVRM